MNPMNPDESSIGACPVAEYTGQRVISLPLFPIMTKGDVDYVIREVRDLVTALRK